jgi:excinuclease ABC subunit B
VQQQDDQHYQHPLFGRKASVFEVTAPYEPTGDQPEAIQKLTSNLKNGEKFSILRGITGTGKTFVMSHVIANHGRPTLVLCHNKTLAAQLCRELRGFLSKNAVELFVSYYDHYVPESFVESSETFIAKKSSVNDEIDALRHRATRALLERKDVVVVASVSCIYGLGLPAEYLEASTSLQVGDTVELQELIDQLGTMLYSRPEEGMLRGNYQLSSNLSNGTDDATTTHVLSLWPPHERHPIRIEIESLSSNGLSRVKSILGQGGAMDSVHVFPAKHHVMAEEQLEAALFSIELELKERVEELMAEGKVVEAQRLQQRVLTDLLMLKETGFCSGGENYSRHFAGRQAGEPPDTLMDYLGLSGNGDWLLVVDESHVTLPQLKAMFGGDQARKRTLVKHGYRLPSALDNRPLQHTEFWAQVKQAVFVSATPGTQELEWTKRDPVEMIIRPTFVCDPEIHVRPPQSQLDDLLKEVKSRTEKKERTLAVALTKRDAEDLADYMKEHGVSATYIHSGLTTHERASALRALQSGDIDCLVGVNLLREGLDLPQVSLVAILNADSEGFLRSETALLQTVGRAARNTNGTAIFYANRVTKSMQRCIDDTRSRRERQMTYNNVNGYESRSTEGSSMMSIFDLLRDEIEEERKLEIVSGHSTGHDLNPVDVFTIASSAVTVTGLKENATIATEHLPSKPGVYFWKDETGKVLYIGKAKKLRSRVKSYLSPGAKHSPRIKVMLEKAKSVDFLLTPSDRDALLLESNLIKHHQPPYNVLLKDDESYPYICASIGDAFPRFFAVPRRQLGSKASKYRYFGPYPHFSEINEVLHGIEEAYDLRAKSFAARHGDACKVEYRELFNKALAEVFEAPNSVATGSLPAKRSVFEEATLLFDSDHNACRDVVAVGRGNDEGNCATVHVLQLREGLVSGRFSYDCEVPTGLDSDEELSAVIQTVLERQHYPSGESSTGMFSFFPNEILCQHPLPSGTELRQTIRSARKLVEPERKDKIVIRTPVSRGPRKQTDARAMEFAIDNAQQVALERQQGRVNGAAKTSVDGTAGKELAALLRLDAPPQRIECYDISHTQGDVAVGSRVVFLNGKPAKHLYRKFNIKTVDGVDDYASLQEVLERRFKRAWVNGRGGVVDDDSPWSLPDLVVIDGGPGQLRAAVKGMSNVGVFPKENRALLQKSLIEEDTESIIVEEVVVGDNACRQDESERSASVAICALAKNQEEVFLYGMKGPVNDSPDSPALLLLRSLRDESHRFALHAHRKRRTASIGLK